VIGKSQGQFPTEEAVVEAVKNALND